MEKTLVLDQSTSATGWVIHNGAKIEDYGVFCPNKKLAAHQRIYETIEWLEEKLLEVDRLVIEEITMSAGAVNTYQILAHLQGAIIYKSMSLGVPCERYLASQWKHTLGVKGRKRIEQKAHARTIVNQLMPETAEAVEDTIDALGIAIHDMKIINGHI